MIRIGAIVVMVGRGQYRSVTGDNRQSGGQRTKWGSGRVESSFDALEVDTISGPGGMLKLRTVLHMRLIARDA